MTIPDQCQVFRASAANLPQIVHVKALVRNGDGWTTRVPPLLVAKSMHVTAGIGLAAILLACSGLVSGANAQTIGSTYTSSAPKDCRVFSAQWRRQWTAQLAGQR